MEFLRQHVVQARHWCAGRSPWPRLLVLLVMGWLVVCQMKADFYATPLSAINLGIHEMGHLLFQFAGQMLMTAAGTGAQVTAPLVAACILRRQEDWFGVAFACWWCGVSLGEMSVYAGDAVDQAMPMVSIGGREVHHDWAWMLDRLDLLDHTARISGVMATAAVILEGMGLVAAAFLVWWMLRPVPPSS
jgi:hypothetical protein